MIRCASLQADVSGVKQASLSERASLMSAVISYESIIRVILTAGCVEKNSAEANGADKNSAVCAMTSHTAFHKAG